jgi:hypothetical protein
MYRGGFQRSTVCGGGARTRWTDTLTTVIKNSELEGRKKKTTCSS